MSDREKRIQEIAYQLWVKEGRPDGRSDSHYFEAVELYKAEIARPGSAKAKPAAEPVAGKPAAEPVAEKPAAEPVAEKPAAEPVAEKPARSGAMKTAESTAAKTTTAEPTAQKPASASKPKPAEPAAKPAPPGPHKPSGARPASRKQEKAAGEVATTCDGAASLLDRISQAFAGDLPGRPDRRHKRRRQGPLPYAQPQDREPRRQPLRRQRDRAAGRRREPGQKLRPRRGLVRAARGG